uniref:Uncharacterized protein n=1 Tax=Lepeophtheirus salmonis TaxID=72036 RepID=A0A0K2U2E5_LEPSM
MVLNMLILKKKKKKNAEDRKIQGLKYFMN